jgi:small subunit ribosomal protein S8e
MVMNHKGRMGRKPTGGRYTSHRSKRSFERGGLPIHTSISENKIKTVRTKGGGTKSKVQSVLEVSLFDAKTKKHEKVKVTSVIENQANRHFVRQNVVTKGAVIETAKGKARVTSRPGQDGTVNAVLL